MCAQRRLVSAWTSAQSDQSSLCAQWVAKDPSFLHADSEDSDQTGWMPRLIWVFAGHTSLRETMHEEFVFCVCVCCIMSNTPSVPTSGSATVVINPHLPSGPVHPYQLDKSISNFRGGWCTFIVFILFPKDIPVSKQCRPRSDAAE